MLAPIVLFTYNRLFHTQQTIEALQANTLAKDSELYIYSDAPKRQSDEAKVQGVRSYLKTVEGFKNVCIIEHRTNQGLAKNIINAVSTVIDTHGKIIVLEDDIVTHFRFLDFMNSALDTYKDTERVWHISGHQHDIPPIILSENRNTFFIRGMQCWGWATWKDRWQYFEKDPQKLVRTFTEQDIYEFNFGKKGRGMFWGQVLSNIEGRCDTWAIFWYATIFQHKGLCLEPCYTLVDNIGIDGTGIHSGGTSSHVTLHRRLQCPNDIVWKFELQIEENTRMLQAKQKEFLRFASFSWKGLGKKFVFYVRRFMNKSMKERWKSIGQVIKKYFK